MHTRLARSGWLRFCDALGLLTYLLTCLLTYLGAAGTVGLASLLRCAGLAYLLTHLLTYLLTYLGAAGTVGLASLLRCVGLRGEIGCGANLRRGEREIGCGANLGRGECEASGGWLLGVRRACHPLRMHTISERHLPATPPQGAHAACGTCACGTCASACGTCACGT